MRAARHRIVVAALAASGCGRDVAQTAFREPTIADETSCEAAVTRVPDAPAWLEPSPELSPLVATGYGGGAGPGLWIVARDAYRVYLNGAFVHESQAPRSPDFVPLSLVPGENEVLVAIWAQTGTPAALLQLDELSGSYVSDDSWHVETSVASGFEKPGYVASSVAGANSLGRLGALPGCDPAAGFPPDTLAHWIGPGRGAGSSAVLRQTIVVAAQGFGEKATGGAGARASVVTTWEELQQQATASDERATILIPEGTYDFRRQGEEAKARLVCPRPCASDPDHVQYEVLTANETCAVEQVMKPLDERRLELGSNKTLVGLGRGAQLRGVSLSLGAAQNVIVRNLALYDVNRGLLEAGDALGMAGAKDVWIDHVTTKWISDGHTDISPGTSNVTLSWMHYDGLSVESCGGHHPRVSQLTSATVTLHHCFFDHADSHAPLVTNAGALVHIFNDLVQDNAGYGVGSACGAQVLLEGTTFRTVTTPTVRRDCGDLPPVGLISAPQGSNQYLADVGKHAGGDGQEPHDEVFVPPYEYQVEPAGEAWPKVLARAGAGGPWAAPLSVDP
jgi:pectate lyase